MTRTRAAQLINKILRMDADESDTRHGILTSEERLALLEAIDALMTRRIR